MPSQVPVLGCVELCNLLCSRRREKEAQTQRERDEGERERQARGKETRGRDRDYRQKQEDKRDENVLYLLCVSVCSLKYMSNDKYLSERKKINCSIDVDRAAEDSGNVKQAAML